MVGPRSGKFDIGEACRYQDDTGIVVRIWPMFQDAVWTYWYTVIMRRPNPLKEYESLFENISVFPTAREDAMKKYPEGPMPKILIEGARIAIEAEVKRGGIDAIQYALSIEHLKELEKRGE